MQFFSKKQLSIFFLTFFCFQHSVFAGNIDSTHKWGWGNYMGWINFGVSSGAASVSTNNITGYAWSSLYGWMNLSPTMAGLQNTCAGDVSGHAWSSLFGYIDFEGVVIDANGYFWGQVTTPSQGNIVFQGTNFSLKTSWTPSCNSTGSLLIDLPLNGSTLSNQTPTLSGNGASPNSQIFATGPSGQKCSTTADALGNWSCILVGNLLDGIQTLSVTEILIDGSALPSKSIQVIIDTLFPVGPSVQSVASDGIAPYLTNDSTPVFIGTGEPNSLISLKDSAGNIIGTGSVDASGNRSIVSNLVLPEGSQQIYLTETDVGGNISVPLPLDFTIDTLVPSPLSISNPSNNIITNNTTPTLNGTGEANSVFEVRDGLGALLGTGTVDGSGIYSFTPTLPLPEGSNTYSVTLIDAALNSSLSVSTVFIVDSSAPTTFTIMTPLLGSHTNNTTPTLNGTGEANSVFEVRDGLGALLGTGTVDGSGIYSFTPTLPLPEGSNTYSVTLIDAALNSSLSVSTVFTIDITTPALPIITQVDMSLVSPYITNDTTPRIMGTGEAGSTVTLRDVNAMILGTALVDGLGNWTIILTTPLPESLQVLTLTSTDIASNTSSTRTLEIIINTSPSLSPSVTRVETSTTSPYSSLTQTPTFAGTGEVRSTITLRDATGMIIGTALVDGLGNWSITLTSPISEGNQLFQVTATNSLGTLSGATPILVYTDVPSSGGASRGKILDILPSREIEEKKEMEELVKKEEPIENLLGDDITDEIIPKDPEFVEEILQIEEPRIILEIGIPTTKTINGIARSYILKNDFADCKTIDYLNDVSYLSDFETQFTDLNNSQYQQEILQMEKVGIVNGDSKKLFQPSRTITRVEFLKIILRAHCYEYSEEQTKESVFTDTEQGTWQAKVAQKGWNIGIVSGSVNTAGERVFRPNDVISKAEALKMLVNIGLLQIAEPFNTSYTDVSLQWYEKYVRDAEYLGIVNARNDSYIYEPQKNTIRDDMVHMTLKLIELYR